MPLHRLYYHVVWATKLRAHWLCGDAKRAVFKTIRQKAESLRAHVYALNGCMDPLHLIVSIPPGIAVGTFVGNVKGASTALYNRTHPAYAIRWQQDYAIFSFDRQSLSHHIAYVECQEEHHREKTTIALLERTGDDS
jgi:REP element-mobilizing transposase RayT